jgi:hypothetical protein
MQRVCAALAVCLFIAAWPASNASADERKHAAYVELFGKGGLWGLGYDYQLHPRLALGGAGSFYVLDGEQVLSLSPYVALYPLGGGRHRWFIQAGPQLVRTHTPSPVPEWDGMSSTGFGAQVSSGYEYRSSVLVRVYAMGAAGEGGVSPWLGVSLGWAL